MSFLVIANGCNGYNQTVIYTIVNGDLGINACRLLFDENTIVRICLAFTVRYTSRGKCMPGSQQCQRCQPSHLLNNVCRRRQQGWQHRAVRLSVIDDLQTFTQLLGNTGQCRVIGYSVTEFMNLYFPDSLSGKEETHIPKTYMTITIVQVCIVFRY